MTHLKDRFDTLRQNLANAAELYQQPAPLMLAVSKKHSAETIRAAFELGQQAFGESYAQEAIEKQQQLADLDIEWHFIGPIQSNKTKDIANHFAWVHSIDRPKIAQRLNDQRTTDVDPLNVCVQINIDDEPSKAGIAPNEASALCEAIDKMPQLRLRGLMCIPQKQTSLAAQRAAFAKLATLQNTLKDQGFATLDTLSMGMSGDYEAAIAEGSTIVRIGTALFGERTKA